MLKKVAQKSLFYAKVTQKSDKYSKKEITQKSISAKKSMILPSNGPPNGPDGPPHGLDGPPNGPDGPPNDPDGPPNGPDGPLNGPSNGPDGRAGDRRLRPG